MTEPEHRVTHRDQLAGIALLTGVKPAKDPRTAQRDVWPLGLWPRGHRTSVRHATSRPPCLCHGACGLDRSDKNHCTLTSADVAWPRYPLQGSRCAAGSMVQSACLRRSPLRPEWASPSPVVSAGRAVNGEGGTTPSRHWGSSWIEGHGCTPGIVTERRPCPIRARSCPWRPRLDPSLSAGRAPSRVPR